MRTAAMTRSAWASSARGTWPRASCAASRRRASSWPPSAPPSSPPNTQIRRRRGRKPPATRRAALPRSCSSASEYPPRASRQGASSDFDGKRPASCSAPQFVRISSARSTLQMESGTFHPNSLIGNCTGKVEWALIHRYMAAEMSCSNVKLCLCSRSRGGWQSCTHHK